MAYDFKSKTVSEGKFDIDFPFVTVKDDDLFFQQVELLMESYLGEWVYDITRGIDFDVLNGKDLNYKKIENEFYSKISRLVNFGKMSNFEIKTDTNRNVIVSMDLTSSSNTTNNLEITI